MQRSRTVLLLALLSALPGSGWAQTVDAPPTGSAPAAASEPATQERDPDRNINLAQPDFTLLTLPTTLRLPQFGSAFRITHRFGRPLGAGDFGDLLGDFFGLDNGALIGLEYRFGVYRGAQVGIHRTSAKTIQFFGQYDVLNQRDGFPVGVAGYVNVEGTNNFRDSYSPAVGALVSREVGDRGAFYVEPLWVNNTNPLPGELVDDNSSLLVGVGGRFRVLRTIYLLAEAAPRLAGYDPGDPHVSFGIEKRTGGHIFQLNFSNDFATTLADVARGAAGNDDWYIGFNISRRFYR